MSRIINGRAIADEVLEELRSEIQKNKLRVKLSNVLVGNRPDSVSYVKTKVKYAEQIGIKAETKHFPETVSESELMEHLGELNADSETNGILVQLPLPEHIDQNKVLALIDPAKDVDGLHPLNVGKLASGDEVLPTCTPYGIIQILEKEKIPIAGRHAVVVGRSMNVGRPMAFLLLNRDATVTICHSKTRDLASITRQADILIVAVGKPKLVTREMVKPGAVVIDVGINRVEGKMVGDVDFDSVKEVAGAITPVPGGVGPMTVATLLRNTISAAKMQGKK